MKVTYLKSALADLAAIRAYIGREDEEAARRVVARIEQCLSYVVIHRVQHETAKIATVFHTSRNRRF